MSAVDFRRFRTWDAQPAISGTPPWRILVRYGYVRLVSSWAGRSLLILLALAAVLSVGGMSYGMAGGSGVDAQAWSGVMFVYLYPLAAILLMVAAPLFADDLRFNAPLFYFSKPVRAGDYFLGKVAYLASLVAAAVLAPILILMVLALLVGVPVGEPPLLDYRYGFSDPADQARFTADWHATHIDSVGEWAAAAAATLPGLIVVVALFTSLAVACSVFTRRGWHAGMAFVALVGGTSLAGSVFADSVRGAYGSLASPAGWADLILGMPLRLMFRPTGPLSRYEAESLQGAGGAIPLAYVLALATTALALWLSHNRIARQEGLL